MRVGVGSWTFPWAIGVPGYPAPADPLSLAGLLDRAGELGVSVVQVADNLPLEGAGQEELRRFRDAARERNIAIEAGTRGVEPAHLLRYLEIARFLDARLVRTLTHSPDSRPDLAQIESWIREVLPAFKDAGVALALENYERHSCGELIGLIESIGSPYVGICLDTVNSLGALEGPREVVLQLAPYVLNVHVKDFHIRRLETMMGYLITGCAAGEGRLDIDWVVGQITRQRKNVSLIVELWTPFSGSVGETVALEREWAARSVRNLRQYEGQTDTV